MLRLKSRPEDRTLNVGSPEAPRTGGGWVGPTSQNSSLLLPETHTRWRHGQGQGCWVPPGGPLCRQDLRLRQLPLGACFLPASPSVLLRGLPWAQWQEAPGSCQAFGKLALAPQISRHQRAPSMRKEDSMSSHQSQKSPKSKEATRARAGVPHGRVNHSFSQRSSTQRTPSSPCCAPGTLLGPNLMLAHWARTAAALRGATGMTPLHRQENGGSGRRCRLPRLTQPGMVQGCTVDHRGGYYLPR